MLQPNFTRRVEAALAALDAGATLIQIIESLNAVNDGIDSRLLKIAVGANNDIVNNANALHSDFASLPSVTRELSARKLFLEVQTLSDHLRETLCDGADEPTYVIELLSELDQFAEAYNTYVVHQIGSNALMLLLVSRRVHGSLSSLRKFLEYFRSNASGHLVHAESEGELSLVLLNIASVLDFANKLTALQSLYDELCSMLNVVTASQPLRIGKIESGSLWARVFGDMKVIGLMITFLEEAARYVHRNYTKEGKIAGIPKKMEALNSILDFSNRLRENGVDVSALETRLSKNALTIADNLNELVSGQPSVELNGQIISVGAEIQKALLKPSETLMLEHSSVQQSENKREPSA